MVSSCFIQIISNSTIWIEQNREIEVAYLCLSFDILDLESWWEGKTKLISLFSIIYNQRVKVLRASDLEFGVLLVLLDFDRGGILSASNEKEFLDLVDLSWHFYIRFLLDNRNRTQKWDESPCTLPC